ncbi:demethylmenaquinone methyltransferase [Mammaliicoccus sciuri]
MDNKSKSEHVHEVFQNISGKYDTLNNIISFEQHKRWRKYTMKQMDVKPGSKALDVCCGTADWTIQLSHTVGPYGEVVGIDFSENMLEVGKKKTDNMANIHLIHGDAMNLPFEDNEFDYVTIGFGLRNVPDYKHVLSELKRVVKPGGMVVCLETSQPTMPVFKQLYRFYFKNIMPLFGKIFAKSLQEYNWLQESAGNFPGKKELAEMFADVGYERIKVKSFTGGVSAMHLAYKPK